MRKIDHSNTVCCVCGKRDTYIMSNGKPLWLAYIENEKWNKKSYQCTSCYNKIKYRSLDSNYVAEWRIGELDPNSPTGKGFVGAQIIAKTLGIHDCNIIMDNFRFYVDLSKHSIYGYVEVKTATFDKMTGQWPFNVKGKKNYDNIFLVCMDAYWKNVERIYVVPFERAIKRSSIGIVKEPSRSTWYSDLIIDEKPFNNVYHNMRIENCKVLRKNV